MEAANLAEWAVQIAGVVALTELVKVVFPSLDKRWLPLFAVAFGLIWMFGLRYGGDVFLTALMGVMVGLAGIGLFSGARAVAGK